MHLEESEVIIEGPVQRAQGDETQDDPQDWDAEQVCNVGVFVDMSLVELELILGFETQLVEGEHRNESPADDATWGNFVRPNQQAILHL